MFHLDKLYRYSEYDQENWDRNSPRETDVLKGACILVRRVVLERIGLLDETFFIYSEEVDMCKRIRRLGLKLAWVPEAGVVHYGGQSTQQVAEEMFLKLYKGKIQYFRKHYGWLAVQSYKVILTLAALARVLIAPLALLEKPPRRSRHLSISARYGRLLATLPGM
jgi:GT2 family glycosyltransferase